MPENDNLIPEDGAAATIEEAVSKQQYDDVVALLKATQADFENYQKRNARERDADRKYDVSALVRDLLPVVDNLERAIAAADQVGDDSALAKGVAATLSQWLQVLARHGITPIESSPGTTFDPNRHEAVMQQPSEEVPPGVVLQVLQQGFQIQDRVLRPAAVIVSSGE